MYHVSAQGVDERMINVHYYYYYYYYLLSMRTWCWWPRDMVWPLPPPPTHTAPPPPLYKHTTDLLSMRTWCWWPRRDMVRLPAGTSCVDPPHIIFCWWDSLHRGNFHLNTCMYTHTHTHTHTHTPVPTHTHADNTADHFSMCWKCWWPRREWPPYPQPRLNTRTHTYTNIQLLSSPIQ